MIKILFFSAVTSFQFLKPCFQGDMVTLESVRLYQTFMSVTLRLLTKAYWQLDNCTCPLFLTNMQAPSLCQVRPGFLHPYYCVPVFLKLLHFLYS